MIRNIVLNGYKYLRKDIIKASSTMAGDNPKYKVLITHAETPQCAVDILKNRFDVIMCKELPPQREEILEKSKDVDAILWSTTDRLDQSVLDAAGSKLKVISVMTSGLNYVDTRCLKQRNIILGYTPDVVNDSVAEIAISLMIAAARRIYEGRIVIEENTWNTWSHNWMLGQDIKGSIVGLVGFGGIGQAIARRLINFDVAQILYTCRNKSPNEQKYNAIYASFDELIKNSDFIIVACPLTPQTQNMFDESAFNRMKATSVFVNIARGGIVDQDALYNALKMKKIFAAGLDVMTPEPLPNDNPLLSLSNCVIIPHLGTATRKTTDSMAVVAALNVVKGLAGEQLKTPTYADE